MSAPKVIGGRLIASGAGAVGVSVAIASACDLLHIREITATTPIAIYENSLARVYGCQFNIDAVQTSGGGVLVTLASDRAGWDVDHYAALHAGDIADGSYIYHRNPAEFESGVTPGTYGDAANIPQITVDVRGRVTHAVNVPAPGNEVLVADGVTPPEPLTLEDETDWLYEG